MWFDRMVRTGLRVNVTQGVKGVDFTPPISVGRLSNTFRACSPDLHLSGFDLDCLFVNDSCLVTRSGGGTTGFVSLPFHMFLLYFFRSYPFPISAHPSSTGTKVFLCTVSFVRCFTETM